MRKAICKPLRRSVNADIQNLMLISKKTSFSLRCDCWKWNNFSYYFRCDVSNRVMVNETVEKVKKDVGDITIVINNAGIMPTHSLLDHTPEEIEKITNVNLLAHFWVITILILSLASRTGRVSIEKLIL